MRLSLSKNIDISARVLVITITLIALFVFGNSMIAVTSMAQTEEGQTQSAPTQCRLVAGVSLPESSDGSMSKGKPVGGEHSLYFSIPAVAPAYNLDDTRPDGIVIETKSAPKVGFNQRLTVTTTASISASKAREFTLVGAKPSGTS